MRWIAAYYTENGDCAQAFKYRWQARLWLWWIGEQDCTIEHADWKTWRFRNRR